MTTTSSATSSSLSSLLGALTGSSSGSSGTTTTTTTTTPSSGSSTSSTGQSILSSAGIGSGLDVSSIVSALVAARQAAPQQSITNQTTALNNQLSGLTQLNSALTSLQSSLTALTTASTYQSYTASLASTSGGGSIGSATTMSSAQPGTYTVAVSQLATAQSRTSSAVATGTAVGAGTLTIAIGSSSMNVAVSATNTLSDIAAAINSSSSNPGVNATIVNGVNGQQLILTSQKTGVANAFTVSANATSSSGLQSLATQLNTAGSSEAQDAKLTINGIAATSASNSVSGVLDGVTLNLTSTGTNQLTVAQDTSAASTAIQSFVTAYNSYVSTASSLTSYDASSSTVGLLLGNSTMTQVQNQINQVLSASVKGNSIGSLANLGITRQADGTLSIDSATLNSTLSSNPSAVQNLFSGTTGYGTTLNNALNVFTTSSSGIIPAQITSINSQLTQLQTEQTALTARMAVYQQQLQAQYTNLDTMMSSLNSTSSYLTTALAQLNNSSSSSKS